MQHVVQLLAIKLAMEQTSSTNKKVLRKYTTRSASGFKIGHYIWHGPGILRTRDIVPPPYGDESILFI